MEQLFDEDRADLSGISNFSASEDRLYISEFLQHALIEVDEIGTKAKAVTYARIRTQLSKTVIFCICIHKDLPLI